MTSLLHRLGMSIPLIQAPMAGTSTPNLAAAVASAGGLGSIALGAGNAEAGRQLIASTRALTDKPFNVNVFCHESAQRDAVREADWLLALAPAFARFGAAPPTVIHEIYRSFRADPDMVEMLVAERPAVVSFHFGLPSDEVIGRLKSAGAVLFATATSLAEGRLVEAAGIDAVVAQGYEAGGHRGMFDPAAPDDRLSTLALVQLLARELSIPVIAAGGIMNGGGIAAALASGALAAQLGTAFIGCPESAADAGHRAALSSEAALHTVMTDVISGRPARCLANGFTAFAADLDAPRAAYPVAYDAGKALNAAAKAAGDSSFGAQWAGQGAPLARALPAAELCDLLMREYASVRAALAVR